MDKYKSLFLTIFETVMMHRLRLCLIVLIVLWTIPIAYGQTMTDVHIVRGSKVILRANATNALSYIWFQNGEPINGEHDERITISEEGIYTVIALGHDCHSELSDPIQVIIDDEGEPITVDMRIHSIPDQEKVIIGQAFSYQIYIVNQSAEHTATQVVVTIQLPPELKYEGIDGHYPGTIDYQPSGHTLIWYPGDMASLQSETLKILVSAHTSGTATQLAIITIAEEDPDLTNNQAQNNVQIQNNVEAIALRIPNVFTPNGDGINDYFEILGLSAFQQRRLFVFNRHGHEVYKNANYQNNWDAHDLNDGTYYYVLELLLPSGKWQIFKGYVTVIRFIRR